MHINEARRRLARAPEDKDWNEASDEAAQIFESIFEREPGDEDGGPEDWISACYECM